MKYNTRDVFIDDMHLALKMNEQTWLNKIVGIEQQMDANMIAVW